MRLQRLSRPLVILALAFALGVTGCGRTAERVDAPSRPRETSSSVAATTSLSSTGTPAGEDSSAAPDPVRSSEAAALERELEAIERELEGLDMPSDSDFQDIEGSLD
jgi:hypothetical protein